MSMPVDSSAMKAAQSHQAPPAKPVAATQAQPSGLASNQPRSHGHLTTVTTTVTASGALSVAVTTHSHPTISRSAIPAASSFQTQPAAVFLLPTTSTTQTHPIPSSANTYFPTYPQLPTPSAPPMVIVPAPVSQQPTQQAPLYIPSASLQQPRIPDPLNQKRTQQAPLYIPSTSQQQPAIPVPLNQKRTQQAPLSIPSASQQQPRIPAQLSIPSLTPTPRPSPTHPMRKPHLIPPSVGHEQATSTTTPKQKDYIVADPTSQTHPINPVPTQPQIPNQLPLSPTHRADTQQSAPTSNIPNFPSQADAAAAQAGRSVAASTQPHPRPVGDPSHQRQSLGNTPRQ